MADTAGGPGLSCRGSLLKDDRARYEFAEQEARSKKAGLQRDGTAVLPWE